MWWEKVGNWDEKKKKEEVEEEEDMRGWERNIEMRKKKGIDMGEREEINKKKNSANFPNFPATQLLTFITSTKFDVK